MLFRQALFLVAIFCAIESGWGSALRDDLPAALMINDEAYYPGSGFDIYEDEDLTLSFNVYYAKPFDEDLLDVTSITYRKEVKRVKRYMTPLIARNVGVITEDVTVEVNGFSPGSTVAEIDVTIPGYFRVSKDELRQAVIDVKDEGVINGHEISKIEELDALPDFPDLNEIVIIDVELTYEYDISDGTVDLSDRDSSAFLREALIIQQELGLHLLAKLAAQGVFISPDDVSIDVLSFRSVDVFTAVTMSIQVKGVTVDQLSTALNYLVIDDDVNIDERLVLSVEELGRPLPDIMDEEDLNGGEREPPDADDGVVVEAEVMPKMDDHEKIPPDVSELPTTEEPSVFEPDLINVLTGERLPHGAGEPVPPFPEIPDHCSSFSDPEFGASHCDLGNDIGSTCTFVCQPDTRLEGATEIRCHEDGTWDSDAPYCIRIFCNPHFLAPDNGELECTDHNVFDSVCTFSCHERFTLKGEETLRCQFDRTWTADEPFCEPDPVNCEDEYGPWSKCENGKRMKDAVLVPSAGSSVICPEMVEECVDCKMQWSDWGECLDGIRGRFEIILKDKVGAGEECPPPREEVEDCVDCEIAWGTWSECSGDKRFRKQVVVQERVGAGAECPDLEEGTEICIDCVLVWEDWSECFDGKRGRSQIVLSPPVGAGKECGELQVDEEDCVDCEVDWSEWSKCAEGLRTRFPIVIKEQLGAGAPCPPLEPEIEDCVDCLLEWGPWEECIEGARIRNQIISRPPVGAGEKCRELETELEECSLCEISWEEWGVCADGFRTRKQYVSRQPTEGEADCPERKNEREDCVDCEVAWGDWSGCIGGKRTRFQTVQREPVGAGRDCPEFQVESEACLDCLMEWGDWSECVGGERVRTEYILVPPTGAGEKCPPDFQTEREVCEDCVVAWGEWSECRNNERVRTEEILQEQIGAGRPCPELRLEPEVCIHCVLEWEPWTPCEGGERTRSQYVLVGQVGAGNDCPDAQTETEECSDCEVAWGEWSECSSNERVRFQYIVKQSLGEGIPCPLLEEDREACIDCVLDWGAWSQCDDKGEKTRSQFIRIRPVGVGAECTPLETETGACINCELDWGEWGECSGDQRSRNQVISVQPRSGGQPCPPLETVVEPCIDCALEWGPWTRCLDETQTREQQVATPLVGAGQECPPLETESRSCTAVADDLVCRFTRRVLGYRSPRRMRDLLLIGDESGSIGWLNFEKIKKAFQVVAKNIRGGIGAQEAQIGMTSFARYSRTLFDFDDFDDVIDVEAAIDRAFFLGGYRSNIGSALTDANTWMFQQTGGMRSFPNVEDNIIHEILIATDGCRTADRYMLKEALKVIKKRGIELYVLAVASKDKRCRETVESMVEDSNNLFEVGNWDDLEVFIKKIEKQECRPRSRADSQPDEEDIPSTA